MLGWQLRQIEGRAVITLAGRWIAQSGGIPAFPADALAGVAAGTALGFDTTGLGQWDIGLIAFLWDAERAAAAAGVTLDQGTLPDAARKLLGLLPDRLDGLAQSAPMLAAAVRGGSLALLGRRALVVEIARISPPDDLDIQAIQVRHGNVLQPSRCGLR